MKNLLSVSLIFILFFFSGSIKAAKAPIKFGKVPMEDLLMEVYELDSTAPAVILCDYGVFDPNNFDFVRTIRIKILNKNGLHYANRAYPTYSNSSIKGRTINIENGEVVVSKLKSESMFRTRITKDWHNIRIAMPNVKVGSVIDIQFSHGGIPRVWHFQDVIPVRWSELRMPESQYVTFRKNTLGYIPMKQSTNTWWISENVPAFKSEPYTDNYRNYMSKMEFEILTIQFPGYYKNVCADWNGVADMLYESNYFGGLLNSAIYLNDLKNEIEASCTSELEKTKMAYRLIKQVKWNKQERLYPKDAGLMKPLKDKIGNSAEINLLLVNLLNKLDINCHPVVLSSRSNGYLSPFYPSLDKLNYVIAHVHVGSESFLLDASEQYLPFGYLPERTLNGIGQIIIKDKAKQINISTDKKDVQTHMYTLNIDGYDFTGEYVSKMNDYGAYRFRKYYWKFNSQQEYLHKLSLTYPNLSIENLAIENLDSIDLPVKSSAKVQISNEIYEIDGDLYFTPLLHEKITENPFKIDVRKYPVNYTYEKATTYMVNITIPEGYSVKEIPKPLVAALSDKGAHVLYSIREMGGMLSLTYSFKINKSMFLPNEYYQLKELYNMIISKHAEPIILTKTTHE